MWPERPVARISDYLLGFIEPLRKGDIVARHAAPAARRAERMKIAVRHGSQLRLGGVVVNEPGIMRDGHASRCDIDDELSVGARALFPATLMVPTGIFSKRLQGVLQLQCCTTNVSTNTDGVVGKTHQDRQH